MIAPGLRRLAVALLLLSTTALARAGTISGRVLDSGGNAVAASRVAWTAYRSEEQVRVDQTAGVQPPVIGETRTGEDGRFVADLPASGPAVSLVIAPSALPGALVSGPLDPTTAVQLPDVELPAPTRVTGMVLAAGGAPIAGARVIVLGDGATSIGTVFFAEAVAGADGAFAVSNAPSGSTTTSARAQGYVPWWHPTAPGRAPERIVLETGGSVSGTVTDVAGRPAFGAIVSSGLVAIRSDSSGRYRLVGVGAGSKTIEAISGEDQIARRGNVVVRPGAETIVDLRLTRAASIPGTVTDEATRRPVPGASIRILDTGPASQASRTRRLVVADGQGRFRAGGLEPGRYTVRADRTGYLPTALTGIIADTASARSPAAAIALEPAASVAGVVVDEKGRAVAGARVHVARGPVNPRLRGGATPGAAPRETVTGPDGAFRLDSLAAARGVSIEAVKSGFAPAQLPGVTLKAGQTIRGVSLTLRAGLTASGRVVDEKGQPVTGAEVRVARNEDRGGRRPFRGPGAQSTPDAVSGNDGTFALGGLEEGDYRATASHEGYAQATVPSVHVAAKGPTVWSPIMLSRGAAIAGVVKDEQGHAIAGALVELFAEGQEPSTAATDGEGGFRIASLASGRSGMVAVSAGGFAPARRSATAPSENLLIVLNKTGEIRGRVVDAGTGNPVADFTLGRTFAPGGRGRGFGPGAGGGPAGSAAVAFHSEDGSFDLVDVPPGSWTMHVTAAGYRPTDISGVDVGEGEVKEGVTLSLKQGRTLAGRVQDSTTGAPVPNATVSAAQTGTPAAPGLFPGTPGAGPAPAVTDANGQFTLDGLPDGKVTVAVSHPDYLAASKDVDLAATADVAIALGPGGEISGVVVGAGGGGVAGATVRLVTDGDTGGTGAQTTQSDPAGAFRFDHLGAGRYQLSAQSKAMASTPQQIVLAENQPMDGVQLPVASGAEIDGTVSGLPADKLGGVNITATADGYRGTAVTGTDGKFTLQNVPTGVVRLSASTAFPAARTTAQTVEVADDATTMPVEIAFQGASRLAGQVTRGGQPLPGLAVNASPDPPTGTGQRSSMLTDDTGRYALEGLDDGGYQVSVNGQGVTYRKAFTVSGDTNGDIALPGLVLSGSVTDSASGAPVDGASIQAETGQESQAAALKRATADSNGFYSIPDMDPGSYQVTARKSGYQLKTLPATLDSQPVEVDFTLDPGAGLPIQISDGLTGIPLGGVSALAFGTDGSVAYQGTVTLDANGKGEIPSLLPGRYAVYVFSAGYAAKALPSVTVPSDTIPIGMTPGGRLEIRPTAPTPARLADASGAIVLLSPFRLDGTLTAAPPVTVWEHISPGSYNLLTGSGEGQKGYPFTIVEGQTTTLALP